VTGVTRSEEAAPSLAVALQQHTTGAELARTVDWVVCAVPERPADELWHAARRALGSTVAIHRVGDCVAPRRAHAAVIEGDRVGAHL
jgi:hypothetical protein